MTRFVEKEKLSQRRATVPAPTAPTGTLARLAWNAQQLRRSVSRALRRARIVAELQQLDDRMLADIGLQRWQIASVADNAVGPSAGSPLGLLGRLLRDLLVEPVAAFFERQAAYRNLMALDDHLLRDIGVSRPEIPALVRKLSLDGRLGSRTAMADGGVIEPIRLWNRSRETARQLQALDDRMLADIGLNRGDIDGVAQELAIRSLRPANRNSAPRVA